MTTQSKRSKSIYGIRAVCREALRTIKPYFQASIPVKLEHLTFTVFYRFLSTFKKKKFKRGIQDKVTGDDQDVEVRLSISTYEGECSELSHLYHDSGKNNEATSPQLWSKL